MPFDINEAIQLGQVLQAAYEVPAEDLAQRAGERIHYTLDHLRQLFDYGLESQQRSKR